MSGTLVTNYVQPDLNTDLTLNQRNSTGNTVAIGALYAGQNANTPLAGATNPTIGSIQSANNYIQNYIFNTANGSFSSADFTAYPNNGTDASGWVDMGITSNNYSQATYSITGRNEGYVLMSAPSGSGTSGNLVFATDSTGLYNSFQWYANGFAQAKSNAIMTLDRTGVVTHTNNVKFSTANTGVVFSDGYLQTSTAIGYGQVWTNVIGSRASGTTYTNTTGRPIIVRVIGTSTVNGGVSVSVNGTAIGFGSYATAGQQAITEFVVPPAQTYVATAAGGVISWLELR